MAVDIIGKDQKRRYLIVSFPDREADENMLKSKEFRNIFPLNKESARSRIFYGYSHIEN